MADHSSTGQGDKVDTVPVQSSVNLDDVGNAEAVIQRMLHERKTLENAATLLATYRSVKNQLSGEQSKLVQMRTAISEAHQALNDAEKLKVVAVAKAQADVAEYVQYHSAQAAQAVAQVQEQVSVEQGKLRDVQGAIADLEVTYKEMTAHFAKEMEQARTALDSVKAEHTAMVASISKAAATVA